MLAEGDNIGVTLAEFLLGKHFKVTTQNADMVYVYQLFGQQLQMSQKQ